MERGPGLRRRLHIVSAYFPDWPHVISTIQRDLEATPEESTTFTAVPVVAELPEVLIGDWLHVAEQLGWPLGRVVAYLALQGAMKITAEAEEGARN